MSKLHTKIQLIDIDLILPYGKNAKLHDPKQVKALAEIIKTNGWDQPIVVDQDYVVIKGHGRRLAAIELGLKKVPVIVRDDLDEAQVKAARLSDNRVAMGDFDTVLLQEELMELSEIGLDLSSLGFNERELEFLSADLTEMDLSSTITDLNDEVDAASKKSEETVAVVAGREISIAQALGFKTISAADERSVSQFMSLIEDNSKLKGAEAFVAFVKRASAS